VRRAPKPDGRPRSRAAGRCNRLQLRGSARRYRCWPGRTALQSRGAGSGAGACAARRGDPVPEEAIEGLGAEEGARLLQLCHEPRPEVGGLHGVRVPQESLALRLGLLMDHGRLPVVGGLTVPLLKPQRSAAILAPTWRPTIARCGTSES